MYAHIRGIVTEKGKDTLVLDVGGVGYLLLVSAKTLAAAPQNGETMMCHTWLSVREDALELYGFATIEEKHMFEHLKSVTGVGPRSALQILSAITVHDIALAIVTDDAQTLTRAPGIGKKTAQRLILELRDKLGNDELVGSINSGEAGQGLANGVIPENAKAPREDALDALLALGYTTAEATRAISRVDASATTTDEILRLALKGMN